MLISKKTKIAVYSYLFQEGVCVVGKDRNYKPSNKVNRNHSDELPISNLEVFCLMRTFTSQGYCNETFNWGYHYFYLTNEGIEFLRQYLGLPADIVPATLKKAATTAAVSDARSDKKGAPGDFKPEFSKEKRDGYRA